MSRPVGLLRRGGARGLALTFLVAATAAHAAPGGTTQQGFASPEAAVTALVDAVRADRLPALERIFGPDGRALVESGDPVADEEGRRTFARAYDEAHEIRRDGEAKATLVVGHDEWPMPVPLVREGRVWRFDTAAGEAEILARRIGRNERDTIRTCLAYVDAQRDYAATDRQGDGLREYARHILSSPGEHDGLYWPVAAGAPESPIGPLVAAARAEGYAGHGVDTQDTPYHGYYFKILTRQGAHAPGGAYDYLAKGHMIGGFALVAFPASWGDSGVMSFIVNQDGKVYQKNLGPQTAAIARAMTFYDPDPSWKPAAP